MIRKTLLSHLFLFFSIAIFGQQNPLDHYVELAIQNNISIKSQQLKHGNNILKLKELKASHLPVLSLQSRYSRAFGGRAFEIPVGDLLNPVYHNLNSLNETGNHLDPNFPNMPSLGEVPNDEVYFLRQKEQETFVRVTFPIFNSDLRNGKQLQEQQIKIEEEGVNLRQKEVVNEVKKTYFDYLKIKTVQQNLSNAKELVATHLKTATSLYDHHKVTIDYVYAAEVEMKSVEKEIAVFHKKEKMVQAYFNLLLNQPATTPIQISSPKKTTPDNSLTLEQALKLAQQNRLELKQFEMINSMSDQKINMEKANRLPEINFVGDYGFQGSDYSFGSEDDFGRASIILSWDILDASNKSKIGQAKIEKELMNYQKKTLQKKIEMEVLQAFYDLETAQQNIELAKSKKQSAAKFYRSILKKYKQGQANSFEMTNARTQLTNAEQEIIIANYDQQIKRLALEKATGN